MLELRDVELKRRIVCDARIVGRVARDEMIDFYWRERRKNVERVELGRVGRVIDVVVDLSGGLSLGLGLLGLPVARGRMMGDTISGFVGSLLVTGACVGLTTYIQDRNALGNKD